MAKILLATASALLFSATTASAQDMWASQMDNHTNAVGSYWSSATSSAIYARNRGANGRRYASPPSSAVEKRERAQQTCANGRRMQANGEGNPGLDRLAAMCAQAGY